MKSEELFRMLEDIDDAYILEAKEDEPRRMPWKIIGTAAAAAAVIGTVWFSARMLSRPTPAPPELAAPVVTAEPGVPDETAPPDSGTELPIPDEKAAPDSTVHPRVPDAATTPEVHPTEPSPVISDAPVQPTPTPPGNPDGQNGQEPPQWGGSGGATLPGSSGSAWPGLPGMASQQYRAVYYHLATGDFLEFYSPVLGIPVVTENITGKIVGGHFSGSISGFPFGQSVYVELQVYPDGSYDLDLY